MYIFKFTYSQTIVSTYLFPLRQIFTTLDISMFIIVYTTLVKSKRKNCFQAAIPCLKYDPNILVKVQRTAARAASEF